MGCFCPVHLPKWCVHLHLGLWDVYFPANSKQLDADTGCTRGWSDPMGLHGDLLRFKHCCYILSNVEYQHVLCPWGGWNQWY